jgi:CHAT domain-containing protein
MVTLILRHTGEGDGGRPLVQVTRLRDGKSTDAVPVPSPSGFPVQGRPNSELLQELRWYLEQFLSYPFPPETEHADRVLDALKGWGEAAFMALFGSGQARDFYKSAVQTGLDQLHLQVTRGDPRVLGWPWEALHDPQAGPLAPACAIERRIDGVHDPVELSGKLSRDCVHILHVTARPDVRYRSLSRPLVELIEKEKLPVRVTILRPPTFDHLRDHLRHNPDRYHIVQFDGHGAYRDATVGPVSPYALRGPAGRLAFEDENGQPDRKTAEQLGALLREHRIPVAVLTACQSGMVDGSATEPFASVAASLVRAGVRSVVAMAYSIQVSGARQFIPAFYQRLFETGNVAQAVRAGRQQMVAHPGRVCARGEYPLQDGLVPVVYQNDPPDFSFASESGDPRAKRVAKAPKAATAPITLPLPESALDKENPYGLVGRDDPILELERAIRRPPAGILIWGLGGVGKTTLARGFVEWLHDTGGLGRGCLWLDFRDIRTAEYVFNQLGTPIFESSFLAQGSDAKCDMLTDHFRDHLYLVVWDNFEVVQGVPGTTVEPRLSEEDRERLKTFLAALRGGRTKVLITSRSEEAWLGGPETVFKLRGGLGGLDGEERWEYCQVVLRDLGLTVDRADKDLVALMDFLRGHPLCMRVILPRLETQSAAQVLEGLRSNLEGPRSISDPSEEHLYSTLRFVERTLPPEVRPLLGPLALHEHYFDARLLADIAENGGISQPPGLVDRLCKGLCFAGLLRDRGEDFFEIHPALTGYLRAAQSQPSGKQERDGWCRAFAGVMARQAEAILQLARHELGPITAVHHAKLPDGLGSSQAPGHEGRGPAIGLGSGSNRERPEKLRPSDPLSRRYCQNIHKI